MEKAREIWQDFETLQTAIEEIVVNDDTEKYRFDFEDLYFKSLATCESIIDKNTLKPMNIESMTQKNNINMKINTSEETDFASTSMSQFTHSIRLAPLEISTFNGSYSE